MDQRMARRDPPKPPSPVRVRVCSSHVLLPPHHPPSRSFPSRLREGTTYALQHMTIVVPPLQPCAIDKVPRPRPRESYSDSYVTYLAPLSESYPTLGNFYVVLDGRVCQRTLFATGRRP